MVKFGYTICYVDDVTQTVTYFEQVFGLKRKFIDEAGDYGELDSGETTLAFASHQLGAANLPQGYINGSTSKQPLGTEIALVTDEVIKTHRAAIQQGGTELKAPMEKPWGQTVSYVRTPSGILLEICSPM